MGAFSYNLVDHKYSNMYMSNNTNIYYKATVQRRLIFKGEYYELELAEFTYFLALKTPLLSFFFKCVTSAYSDTS